MLPISGASDKGTENGLLSKVLPAVTQILPLAPTESNKGSLPPSARSSFEQVRESGTVRRDSGIAETPRSSAPKATILKAFLPRVAVYASDDTEELVRLKGVYGGLCGLLRPFGETVQGKVGIRDSVGVSKGWDDYGVHFIRFGGESTPASPTQASFGNVDASIQEGDWSRILKGAAKPENTATAAIDETVERELQDCREASVGLDDDTPSYYNIYLRKLFADRPLVPHDTFPHPVACVIAISSQSGAPIETLRDLYHDTRRESNVLPHWVSSEFLRYYVLVHDEDNDDIGSSTALFAQMKRHFGLHCHMLRLRSTQCTLNDKDGSPLPHSDWLTADEDVANQQQKDRSAANELQQFVFQSDALTIRSFVRELVTQSIVPFMEGRVTTWNDQVASRRRGVSGRIMSLSKRWTNFGSVRGRNSSPAAADKDYDRSQGAYKPESAQATMHRLADYAFMLRDWKLASSTYDLLRGDFNDDKAWHHYAIAHEMTAASMLMTAQVVGSRGRVDIVNQLLDTASYSFITRCSSPQEATRCMILAIELYLCQDDIGSKESARWGSRLLDLSITSPLAQVLVAERLVRSWSTRSQYLSVFSESPFRKSALWSLLASDGWVKLKQPEFAVNNLDSTIAIYGNTEVETEVAEFEGTQDYLRRMRGRIAELGRVATPRAGSRHHAELDTFIEDMAEPSANEVPPIVNPKRQSISTGHRHRVSQHNIVSVVSHNQQPLREDDDGFS